MTTASVPSTLVKCLYLFFDLPEMSEEEADVADANSEFTPRERRILLQKIFVQVKDKDNYKGSGCATSQRNLCEPVPLIWNLAPQLL